MQTGTVARLFGGLRFWRRDLGSREDMREAWRFMERGQYHAAEEACRRLLRDKPSHVEALHCLGALHQRAGRHAEAIPLLGKVIALAPANVPAHANLAQSLAALGRFDEAEEVIDRALALTPDSAAAARSLAGACMEVARYSDALTCCRRAIEYEPADPANWLRLAMNLRRLGRAAEALAAYDEADRLVPNDPAIVANRGNVLCDVGRLEEAAAAYRRAIRMRPDYVPPHGLLAAVRHHHHNADVKAMEALYAKAPTPSEERMLLAFGLGKAFDDLGEYDRAFGYFLEANALRRRMAPYSIAGDEALFARVKSTFDREFFASRRGLGRPDARPIFVLGMPRSGTSLVEQILASHPEVHGAGELPDLHIVCRSTFDGLPGSVRRLSAADWRRLADRYLRRVAAYDATKPFVTDKLPDNFLRIGMIATMLPNARIVHCARDPVATCLSAFKSFFSTPGLWWSYDLADTGRYYRLYADLMDHWRAVLPGRLIEVRYEELVAAPEPEIRRLLEACGLDFHESVLSFHESERPVLTRSFAQVRRPMYGDSLQAWKRYERHLGPLIEALGMAGTGAR